MTLFDAILGCIEGPCTIASDKNDGRVSPEAWAGLITQAVTEWCEATALEAPLLAVMIEKALYPLEVLESGAVIPLEPRPRCLCSYDIFTKCIIRHDESCSLHKLGDHV